MERNAFVYLFQCLRSLAIIVYHLIRCNAYSTKKHFRNFVLRKKFFSFFDGKSHYFVPKFLGVTEDEIFTTFTTVFNNLGEMSDLSVFVKMDIEGAEYETLVQTLPFAEKINGLVVEFHNLDKHGEEFEQVLEKLFEHFYIVHTHGCNFGDLIGNTLIPKVLEISFINKKLLGKNVVPSKQKYPLENLDTPNNPYQKDYALNF